MKSLIPKLKKFWMFGLVLGLIVLLGLPVLSANPARVVSAQSAGGTPSAATVQVATDPKLGQILVAGNGMTLYVFMIDKPGVSNCTGACLTTWPALTVSAGSQPTAGAGVVGKLGTITRPDGPTQVTINDMPLYFFIGDKKPGDTTGQGINGFGGLWYTVKPDGTPNTGTSTQPTTGANW